MAVDLSRVGLEGIETGQRTLNSIAQREALASQTQINEQEEFRKQAELDLDQLAVDRARSIMAGDGVDLDDPELSTDDSARFMSIVGQQLLRAGAPKRGKEMIEAGMDLQKKKSEIESATYTQQKTRLENMTKAGQWVYEALGDVGNDSEYQYTIANMPPEIVEILGDDNVEQLKSQPWSPELTNYFRQKALSTAEAARLELLASGQERAERATENARIAAENANAVAWARLAEARRARLVQEKAQGATGLSKAPTTDERKAAQAAILGNVEGLSKSDFEGDSSNPQMIAAVDDIVSAAKQMVDANRGLTMGDAMNRAVLEAKANGDFNTIRSYKDFGLFQTEGTKSSTYKRKGTSETNPAPLPNDPSKLVRGKWYQGADGTVRQFK